MAEYTAGPAGAAFGIAASHAERELGYLVRFKTSVKFLEAKFEQLSSRRNDVKRRMVAATRNGELILDAVTTWLKSVEEVEVEVKKLIDDAASINSCFKGWFFSRFILGRKAQKKVAVVQGLLDEVNTFGSEVSLDISVPALVSTLDFVGFLSRESIEIRVLQALKDDGIGIIGVYGMPGIGKTMTISVLVNHVKEKKIFDEVAVVKLAQNSGVRKVQDDLANELGLKFEDKDTLLFRARRLSERLKQDRRTLIFLDNLWERIDLTEVGIPCKDGRKNCKVIFTTRDQDVCNFMDTDQRIEVPLLRDEESRHLFRLKVGDSVDSPDIEVVAGELVNICKGLPLAIVTLGRALHGKDQSTWANAHRQLQNSILTGMPVVLSCIKLSYDFLKSQEEKMCLLFCCFFPSGYPISEDQLFHYMMGEKQLEAVVTLEEARNSLHSVVGRLTSACLLLKAENGRIRMHDVVRHVVVSIASDFEKGNGFIVKAGMIIRDWPDLKLDECKRLSLMYNNIVCSLPLQIRATSLLTLSLHGSEELVTLPPGIFEEMKSLMTLDLSYTGLTVLPNSIECLSNLCTLRLEGCHLMDVVLSNKLERLEILSVRYSTIENLHVSGEKMNLKLLDLSSTQRLESISSKLVSSLYRLEELYALKSFNAWEVEGVQGGNYAANLSEVASLARVTSLELHIKNPECLYHDVPRWEKLGKFKLVVGSVQTFTSIGIAGDGIQSNSMYLQLNSTLSVAKWVIMLLGNTEFIHLDGSKPLKDLLLADTRWSEGIFYKFRVLTLSGYRIAGCILSRDLLLRLPYLEKLVVNECPILEKLIEFEGEDENSQLHESSAHTSMGTSIVPFINGSKFPRVQLFTKLTDLRVCHCPQLKYLLPVRACRDLLQLKNLYISNCPSMEMIILHADGGDGDRSCFSGSLVHWDDDDDGGDGGSLVHWDDDDDGGHGDKVILPRLKVFSMHQLPQLLGLSSTCVQFDLPALEELVVEGCGHLQELPLGDVPKLTKFAADHDWLDELQATPNLKVRLQHLLRYEHLRWCKDICEGYGDQGWSSPHELFSNLRALKVSLHQGASLIPYGLLKSLQNLDKLMVDQSQVLENLIDFSGEASLVHASTGASSSPATSLSKIFPNLTFLSILDCRKLMHLLPRKALRDLLKLERLYISGCTSMKTIIAHERDGLATPVYTSVGASSSPSTSRIEYSEFPPSPTFPNLTSIRVSHCAHLVYLFPVRVMRNLLQLEELYIYDCLSMEVIIALENAEDDSDAEKDTVTLPKLKILSLIKLSKLTSLVQHDLLVQLPALELLVVEDCCLLKKLCLSNKPKLTKFIADADWFDRLEWKDHRLKSHFESLLNYEHLQGHGEFEDYLRDPSHHEILYNLRVLKVSRVHKHESPSVIQCDLLVSLRNLDKLVVERCWASETVFQLEGQNEAGEEQVSLLHTSSGASSSTLASGNNFAKLPPSPLFSNLTNLRVCYCFEVKYIFPMRVVQGLFNLERLHISDCPNIERVIVDGDANRDKQVLPKLKILSLRQLPKLLSFAEESMLFDWFSLEELTLEGCSEYRRLILPIGPGSVPKLRWLSMEDGYFQLQREDKSFESRLLKILRRYMSRSNLERAIIRDGI